MMNDFWKSRQTTIPLHERPDLDDKADLILLVHLIDFARNERGLREQLVQLHNQGPCWDGDVVSKSERDALLQIGACEKVIVKGEEGFNACTYLGRELMKIYEWLYGPYPSDPGANTP